jgi:outer membrane autotransporter protein
MSIKVNHKQRLAAAIAIVAGLALGAPAWADEAPNGGPLAGFYGGVSVRDQGTETIGLQLAPAAGLLTRLVTPVAEETSTRALLFGGYRWNNDVAVEAAFSSADKYSLRPTAGSAAPGVRFGSVSGGGFGLTDVQSRTWNLDVYTSWAFYRSFSLYGRLGYVQAEANPMFANTTLATGIDNRRTRDGVNYGVGLKYGISSNLGLRLEYARFARFGIDTGAALPETDQLSLGMQFKF